MLWGALALASPREPELDAKSARQMIGAGTGLTLASTWSIGMLAARLRDSPRTERQELGRVVPLPFVGPIVYAASGRGYNQPLGAFLALAQGGGLAFTTIGAVSLVRNRDPHRRRAPLSPKVGQLAIAEGLTVFAMTYGMTAGFTRQRVREGDEFSRRLQAPIIGGFWAAPVAPNYTRGYLGLTTSAVQLVSVSAVVFGAVILSRRRARGLSVLPVPTQDGARLVAGARF